MGGGGISELLHLAKAPIRVICVQAGTTTSRVPEGETGEGGGGREAVC